MLDEHFLLPGVVGVEVEASLPVRILRVLRSFYHALQLPPHVEQHAAQAPQVGGLVPALQQADLRRAELLRVDAITAVRTPRRASRCRSRSGAGRAVQTGLRLVRPRPPLDRLRQRAFTWLWIFSLVQPAPACRS